MSAFYTQKNLNRELYQLHLLLANVWSGLLPCVENIIAEKLEIIFNIKYQRLDKKMGYLARNQVKTPDNTSNVLSQNH